MKAISYYFLRGETTVRNIVETTSESLWSVLQPLYMPVPTKESWTNVAERYQELWNLPNCVGSIDGKHIRIKAPANSGSAFYNYKGFFSIVLMATADADGKFITIDVGEYGRNSDGRVLKECAFGQQLLKNKLDLPEPSTLPGEENEPPYAYYFVGDEAFPLMNNLLRPYPRRQLTNAKRIFNYRLSRGHLQEYSTGYSGETQFNSQENRSRTRPSNVAVESRDRLCYYFLKPYACTALAKQLCYLII
eukprot:XP_008183357.2 PREDICTED: uncharacterized protein LOC103309529 [Acyrthosiphon pisum]